MAKAMEAGRTNFARELNVSRETMDRFDAYVTLLAKWQPVINLVSSKTLQDVWTRHLLDSAQIKQVFPQAKSWIDLGSGAGFPGLVIAILLAENNDAVVHLVEVDQRKCTFLREVIRATGAPAIVHQGALETILVDLNAEALTSRALARLELLVEWSRPLLIQGTKAVFPKGRDVALELNAIMGDTDLKVELRPSRTDPEAQLVLIEMAARAFDANTI